MLRLLIFIFSIVFFAAAATILLTLGQSVQVAAFGWKMDAPAGVAGAAVALFLGVFGLLVSLYKDIAGMRRRRVLRGVLRRREKGVDALVEAAAAHARADYHKAGKLSQKASKLLDRDDVIALFAPPSAPEPAPVEIEVELDPAADASPAAAPLLDAPADAAPAALPAPPAEPAWAPEQDAEEALDRDADAARRVS
ncbi:MAG TPA: hypothetical protein DEA40_00335 [Parvularcula sp.]|nr:hypothetical protein [Parvularcula sp.]